ncbi:MAG: metal-dependent hydrolase [Haloarculaceae archaeon]
MFVGHALLAFAVVALLGERLDWDRGFVLRAAALAGLFAMLPDVDVVYGLAGLAGTAGAPGAVDAFWAASNRVHRGVTHSLVVAGAVALAVAALGARERASSLVAFGLLTGVIAVATAVSGPVAGAVTLLFVAGALGLVVLGRVLALPGRTIASAAALGLGSHPFGDLFTGTPPAMAYPLDVTLVAERVTLAADPTLHLLGAFAVELAVVWLALVAACRLLDCRVRDQVDRRAAVGVAYGAAALALPAPTLDVAYHFVFSVLAVGAVGFVTPAFAGRSDARASWSSLARVPRVRPVVSARSVGTALATVTVAAAAYASTYLVL